MIFYQVLSFFMKFLLFFMNRLFSAFLTALDSFTACEKPLYYETKEPTLFGNGITPGHFGFFPLKTGRFAPSFQ